MFISCTSIEKTLFKQIVIEDKVLTLVHHYCEEVAVYVHHWVLWPSIFLIFIVWNELKNFAANNLLSWCLKSRTRIRAIGWSRTWEPCIKRGTVTTEQVQLGIEIRIQLLACKVLEILLLVTACCDNSGVLRMVTWKSPDVIFAIRYSLFVNKSPCHLFSAAYFSCLVICLCYHALCM